MLFMLTEGKHLWYTVVILALGFVGRLDDIQLNNAS